MAEIEARLDPSRFMRVHQVPRSQASASGVPAQQQPRGLAQPCGNSPHGTLRQFTARHRDSSIPRHRSATTPSWASARHARAHRNSRGLCGSCTKGSSPLYAPPEQVEL